MSTSWPDARSRSTGSAGSRRLSSRRWSQSGLCSTKELSADRVSSLSSTRCSSSMTSIALRSPASSRSSLRRRIASRGPAGSLRLPSVRSETPGASGSTAEMSAAQNCAGSRSDSSRVSQAAGNAQPLIQSAASAVLPAPAGATTAVTGYAARSSSSSVSLVRWTRWCGVVGTRNLDRKNGESRRPPWTDSGCARPDIGHLRVRARAVAPAVYGPAAPGCDPPTRCGCPGPRLLPRPPASRRGAAHAHVALLRR